MKALRKVTKICHDCAAKKNMRLDRDADFKFGNYFQATCDLCGHITSVCHPREYCSEYA